MKFHVLTLFPEMVLSGLGTSILGRAAEEGKIQIDAVNIRDYTLDKHKKVDDYPYGGGAGMLMQAQPVYDAMQAVKQKLSGRKEPRVLYMTPQGTTFHQGMAEELAKEEDLIFLCGHYEGIDERVLEEVVTDYVSIGDFVLTGGELPAMMMIDAIARLVPGVLHNDMSACEESFHNSLLEHPHYTRPEEWHGKRVPDVLLSGNHKEIVKWRREQSEKRTRERRADLFAEYQKSLNAIEQLKKWDKVLHIDMIETIRLGRAKIWYQERDGILIQEKKSGILFLSCTSEEAGEKALNSIPQKDKISMVVSHQDFLCPLIEQWNTMNEIAVCYQAAYTRNVPLPVTKELTVKKLGLESLEILVKHYHLIPDEAHMRGRLEEGKMYGAFLQEKMVGFIGEHEEGGMGILEVFPEHRRKGYGIALEAFLINQLLRENRLPYCQIIDGNHVSYQLQEKLGLRISKSMVYWMEKTDEMNC